MLTLDNYRDHLVTPIINGVTVRFLLANGQGTEAARVKVKSALRYLTAMPQAHLAAAFPIIFIAGSLPSSGGGGGTPDHPDVLIRRRAEDIGASTEVMQALVQQANAGWRRSGFHWIPPHIYADDARLPHTVAHEVIHGIDINLRLHVRRRIDPLLSVWADVPEAHARNFNSSDFPTGLRGQACRSGVDATRLSVNAYLSLISSEHREGRVARRQRQRIVASLKVSEAFASVPWSWWTRYSS